MADSAREMSDKYINQINSDMSSLVARLTTGGRLIDAEMNEGRKAKILASWSELDKLYKRLNIIISILRSPDAGPLQGAYCAVCLGLIKPDDLLHAGWATEDINQIKGGTV